MSGSEFIAEVKRQSGADAYLDGDERPNGASDVGGYARQLKQLLPPGLLWVFESDSKLSATMTAIADELNRVDDRARDLFGESDPRTALETLGEWERVLGLPDACVTEIPDTSEERRLAVTQKYVKTGGQTPAYYVALAAACGYTATARDDYGSSVLRAGFRVGDRCYGTDWAHAWSMEVQPPAGPALSHAELECIIGRVAPAHTTVFFEYL